MSDFPYNTRTHRIEGASFSALFFSAIKDGVAELVEGYEYSSSSSMSSSSESSSLSSLSSSSMSSSSFSSSSISSMSSSSVSSSSSSISLSSESSVSSPSSSSVSSPSSSSTEHICNCVDYSWYFYFGANPTMTDKITDFVSPEHIAVEETCDLWVVVKNMGTYHYVWAMTSVAEAMAVAKSPSATGATSTTVGWGYGSAPGTITLTNDGSITLSSAFTYSSGLGTVFKFVCLKDGTVYVSTAGDDDNDGLSPSTPKITIQAGVDIAAPGYTVIVAAGTYVLSSTIVADKEVYIQGENAFSTIIDGNDLVRCVELSYGATVSDMTIMQGYDAIHGGGAYLSKASKLNRCIVRDNAANPVQVSGVQGGGGGITMIGQGTRINNCLVFNNICTAVYAVGGGVWIDQGGFIDQVATTGSYVCNCTICDNQAAFGGGIAFTGMPGLLDKTVIANSIVLYNSTYNISGQTLANNIVTGTVDFVDRPSDNYRLASTATNCIHQGNNSYAVGQSYDLDLRDRIVNYVVDIGAYEYDHLTMMTDVYVSPSGNDANPGTEVSPKGTISGGLGVCLLGGTVHLMAGTHVLSSPVVLTSPPTTVGKKIVGEDPLTTIVDGGGAGVCFEVSGYSEIHNITVQNGSNSGIRISDLNATGVNTVLISRCIIKSNSGSNGGGISVVSTTFGTIVQIGNCLIRDNMASGTGGGIYSNNKSNTYAVNSTICDNSASGGGGGCYYALQGSAVAGGTANSIVYFNLPSDIVTTDYNQILIQYSCTPYVAGMAWVGSITSDPSFEDRPLNDYSLAVGSPCIDTGDVGFVSGSYGSTDLAGNTRIAGASADMGAYERQS